MWNFEHLQPQYSPWMLRWVYCLSLPSESSMSRHSITCISRPDRSCVYSARRTNTHAHTYACTHASMHARTHARTYTYKQSNTSSSLVSRSVPFWAKASPCRLHVSLYCAVLCQIVSLKCLSRSSLHRLAGLPCLFLSYGRQLVTCEVRYMCMYMCVCAHACMLTHMHTLHILELNFHLMEEISPFTKTFTNRASSPTHNALQR